MRAKRNAAVAYGKLNPKEGEPVGELPCDRCGETLMLAVGDVVDLVVTKAGEQLLLCSRCAKVTTVDSKLKSRTQRAP